MAATRRATSLTIQIGCAGDALERHIVDIAARMAGNVGQTRRRCGGRNQVNRCQLFGVQRQRQRFGFFGRAVHRQQAIHAGGAGGLGKFAIAHGFHRVQIPHQHHRVVVLC